MFTPFSILTNQCTVFQISKLVFLFARFYFYHVSHTAVGFLNLIHIIHFPRSVCTRLESILYSLR